MIAGPTDAVLKVGPVKDGKYDFSVVTDGNYNTLYVLARHYDSFKDKYDSEVKEFLNANGFSEGNKAPLETPQGGNCEYPSSFTGTSTGKA